MKRFPALLAILFGTLLLMGADGCSSDPNVEGAKLDLRNKDYDRALQNLDTAISNNPTNAAAYELKGRVLSEKAFATEDLTEHVALIEQMVEAFNRASEYDQTLQPTISRNMAIAYVNEFQRGFQAFNRGRDNSAEFASAAVYFGSASTIAPDSAGAYVNQAYAYMNSGDTQSAVRPFEMALEKGDTEVDTYRFLASLYQAADRLGDAVSLLEQASDLYPGNADVQAELLNAYQIAGQTDRAVEVYAAAVESDPDNKLYRYNYGSLLVQMENYTGAIDQLKKAIELDPGYANAQYNLGAAYINEAVSVNERINELDDALRANRDGMTNAQVDAQQKTIDELVESRRQLFENAITPLSAAKVLFEDAGDDVSGVCMALYQSYVQTNQLELAESVSTCAGYDEN